MTLLQQHHWPGNVSELKRVSEQLVRQSGPALLDSSLLPAHMIQEPPASSCAVPQDRIEFETQVRQFEQGFLQAAMKQARGVQTRAAQLLGLKLTTFNSKITRYGIDPAAFK
jgi:Nif-specific regulatory protein